MLSKAVATSSLLTFGHALVLREHANGGGLVARSCALPSFPGF